MIEFGKTLREAREAKGLTAAQIADKTHMMVQVVEGLEREDFSRIVAPIYGRGFVKLYCEAVGLDPKPHVDAFMEIYASGRKPAAPQPPPPAPKPPPEPEPEIPTPPPVPTASEPPVRPMELDFSGIRPAAGEPPHAPTPNPAPVSAPAPKPAPASMPKTTASRYAAPMPIDDGPRFSLPPINWRLVALLAATVALLVLFALGVRAIYHATMTAPDDDPATQEPAAAKQEAPKPAPAAKDAKPAATTTEKDAKNATQDAKPAAKAPASDTPRKPLPPRAFYIDSDHSTEKEKERK